MNQINLIAQSQYRLLYPFLPKRATLKGERGRHQAERSYYAGNPLQQCIVCGRQFIRRRDKVYEVDCAERAKAICAAIRRADPRGGSLRRVPSALTTVAFYTGEKI